MSKYRGEMRVFGLLVFALVATVVLHAWLSTAKVDGKLLEWEFTIGGPAALLVVLVGMFHLFGLLRFRVEEKSSDNLTRPVDKMTGEEALRAIDELEADRKEIGRRQESLKKYVESLEAGKPADEAMSTAFGMRPARRGG